MEKIKYIILILIIGFLGFNIDTITNKISSALKSNPKITISTPNSYYKNSNYNYVKLTKNYVPYSKQDLKDIFYSILDSGYETFTFYCPSEYTECLTDIEDLSNDKQTLTYINNYVNPYNSYNNIRIIYSTTGEINVQIDKLYKDEEIQLINNKINEISENILNDEMNAEDKILAIHDYIINNTKYDELRANGNTTYKSNTAYGSLIEGYAVCGGYADAMAIFLDLLNIPNYKVSSETHVWNAVYINEKWLHLDLTWDDPITLNSDIQTLTHKFYLIDTTSLESYNISDHDFDKTIYQELA